MPGFELPLEPGASETIVLEPTDLTSDADTLTFSATVPRKQITDGTFDYYLESGDIKRVETAFGAFRRVDRSGRDPVTVTPTPELTPPFEQRVVLPVETSVEHITAADSVLELTLGLVEPRPREPIQTGDDAEKIDERDVLIDAGETSTLTVTGTAPSEFDDYTATVEGAVDSDSVIISVSEATFTFGFTSGTLALNDTQVGTPVRESDRGQREITVPVQLRASQAATLFAVGSRITGAVLRETPGASNVIRDTLPEEELTASVETVDVLNDLGSEAVLRAWELTDVRLNRRFPFTTDLTFAPT